MIRGISITGRQVSLQQLLVISTGDSELPGNYAMWDQLEALKWVKEHIAGKLMGHFDILCVTETQVRFDGSANDGEARHMKSWCLQHAGLVQN